MGEAGPLLQRRRHKAFFLENLADGVERIFGKAARLQNLNGSGEITGAGTHHKGFAISRCGFVGMKTGVAQHSDHFVGLPLTQLTIEILLRASAQANEQEGGNNTQ